MGIISSIFGERPSAPQTGGFTVGAEIPKELAPFYKDILGKSQALYNDSVSQGYQPYTGPSLAEFSPEQQQAFTGIAGLQGQQAPIYQEAMGMTRDSAAPITSEQIEEYMNPYQQAVVDIEKREAQKQYQSQVVPQLAAKAAMAQPFGGSRQAILEGMAADTQQRLLGDIQAKGSAQAYQDSVNLINQQRMQQGNAAGQLATLGSNQFKSQLGELGALQTIGEDKQQLAQQALNEAYGQYIKEQEYPFQQLGRYQSVVTGAPIQQTQYVPPTPPGPSTGQQLLGGAATMLGTYGAFGGQMPNLFGGATPAKTGGGIGDLPVIKRQQNASVNDDALSLYKRMLGKRPTARDLQEIQKLSNINVNKPPFKYKGAPVFTSNLASGYSGSRNPSDIRMGEDSYGPLKALVNQSSGPYLGPETNMPNVDEEAIVNMQDESGASYIPPSNLSEGSSISAIKDMITDRMSGLKKILQDKRAKMASRQKLKFERLTSKDSPFSDRNKPPMYAEKEDVRPDSPGKQDLEKIINFGGKIIGNSVDLLNKGNNWLNKNLNSVLKIGETYVLKPGDDQIFKRLPIRTNKEARELFNKYNYGGRDIPTSKKDQKEIDKKINTVDMRPGFNEGLIVEAENIIKKGQDSNNLPKLNEFFNKPIKASASEIKEVLAFDGSSFIEDFYKGIGPKVNGVKNQGENLKTDSLIKIEKLASTFNNKKEINKNINKSDDIVKKNAKEITTTNKENNLSLKDLDKRAKIIANNKKKLKEAEEANKPTKKIKSDLDKAQDKYLDALKKRNDKLDGKEKLINQSKTESFWAFVARVGANISKGGGISESVAAELPQAMKDRQKLIQAKSDLDDKKDDGLVNLAKAEMTIETADAAAIAAREKEERGYASKERLEQIKADNKDNFYKGNFKENEDLIKRNIGNLSNRLLNSTDDQKLKIIQSAPGIIGVDTTNFNDAFKEFQDNITNEELFSIMKQDRNRDNLSGAELVKKIYFDLWKQSKGNYREGTIQGFTVPKFFPGNQKQLFDY